MSPRLWTRRVFNRRGSTNPWLVILLTAPIPLILFVLFLVKWYQQRGDLDRVTQHFMERQNKVLAYEATRVARLVSELLENASRDAEGLSLIPTTTTKFQEFYRAHNFRITEYDLSTNALHYTPYPAYNELSFIDRAGNERVRLNAGKPAKLRTFQTCRLIDLCDRPLWEKIMKAKKGDLVVGDLLRYYSKRSEQEQETGATFRVAFRSAKGTFVVGIDYRHWKEILHVPTFPYETRRKLLQAYLDGNYSYIVDADYDFLAHPKHWHVRGVDRKTGDFRTPVDKDIDLGQRPVNVSAYHGEELKDYFNRLVNKSFTQKTVDIFRAPNLTGKTRVLSIAPVLFDRGQFKNTGIFGYIVTGCNVEFFEEPKEKLVPYY